MQFRNLNLRTKMLAASIMPLFLVLLLSAISYYSLMLLISAVQTVDETHEMVNDAQELRITALEAQSMIRGFLVTGENAFLEGYQEKLKNFDKLADLFKNRLKSESQSQQEYLAQCLAVIEEWKTKSVAPAIEIRQSLGSSKLSSQLHTFLGMRLDQDYFVKFEDLIHKFIQGEYSLLKERKSESDKAGKTAFGLIISASLAVILASFLLWIVVSSKITKPLRRAVDMAESISAKDLTGNLKIRGRDEVGRLGQSLNDMVQNLRTSTREISSAVNILSGASTELSSTAVQLSESTSKTSGAISETVATVTQLKQAAQISQTKAKKVLENSEQATRISDEGRKSTQDTIEKINLIKTQMSSVGDKVIRLSEHSNSIEQIIDSVRDIADQSKLLAVNASIEAARAGDYGRGFSVVATEIKNLADQSRVATEQVRSILDDTKKYIHDVVTVTEQGSKAVETGVSQSAVASQTIEELINTIGLSAQDASIIDASITQQLEGIHQVSFAMANVEEAMRQNVAGSTQLETAVRKLSETTDALKELIQYYKLN